MESAGGGTAGAGAASIGFGAAGGEGVGAGAAGFDASFAPAAIRASSERTAPAHFRFCAKRAAESASPARAAAIHPRRIQSGDCRTPLMFTPTLPGNETPAILRNRAAQGKPETGLTRLRDPETRSALFFPAVSG
jgi:hypothetical protein